MLTRIKRGRIALALAAVAGLLTAMPPSADAAGLLIADGGLGGVLEIKEQDVKVTINNGIAVTEINQVFVNTEDRQVEALYTFPVPKGASVANFSMWINGKEMIGEVVEKERAREIYNSYKRVRRDPGLLEQTDYKTFEMRIFPIEARAEQRVRVTYYQQLDYDHNWGTYVYPLATVTRNNIDQRTTGKFALSLDIRSAVPIVSMESPSHGDMVVTAEHAEDYWQASLETDGGDLARDIVIAYKVARPITGLDLVTSKQRGEDGFFLLTLTAGEELAEVSGGGADYVFILDVSGSMAHDGKLRLSRESLNAFIDSLGEGDRFELVTFNVKPTTLFSSLVDADVDTKARAEKFLDSQQARGGTSLHPAITTAYKYGDPDRDLNVVILSDGMTEQRERRQLSELIRQRPDNARVFCIGIGNEVNRPLLEQIADDAGGLAAFVSHGDDFERQAKAFRRKLMHPVATDLAIDLRGADVYDIEPTQLPNLYHGAPIRVFGRYRNGSTVEAKITGEVRGKAISTKAQLDFPKAEAGNTEIERMWAWHRIDRLLKDGDRKGSRASVTDEVIRLGEAFSIASEYTSFIVLENDSEYARWKIDQRNALRVQRDRAGRERVQEQLTRLRRKSAQEMGPIAPTTLASGGRDKPDVTNQVIDTRQASSPQTPDQPRRRVDLDVVDRKGGGGGGFGGGAIDPFTAALAMGLGGLALKSRRKRLGKSGTRSGS